MKFILCQSPNNTPPDVEISKDKFNQLKVAKVCLAGALAIEEKYELLISNYLDFEKECLNITADHMVRESISYANFFDINITLNRRMVNLLTSAKLYKDQIYQHIKACIPLDDSIQSQVKSLFSAEYDAFFEYRFMEALRNYVQHRGLAVHSTSIGSSWTSSKKDGMNEYRTTPFTHKTEVTTDKAFKVQVANEMPDKVGLIYATRTYIESINKVHCYIRDYISQTANDSRNLIGSMINSYEDRYTESFGVNAVCKKTDEKDNIVEVIPLLLDWDDVRIALQEKNKKLASLKRRYVTGNTYQ